MTLNEALGHISAQHYARICGYCYRPHTQFGELEFKDLPKDFQDGIIVLILRIYQLQKMTYSYEFSLVAHYMKSNGIKLRPFFKECDLPATFARTLSLQKNRELRLMSIRLEMIRTLNRLFRYVLPQPT